MTDPMPHDDPGSRTLPANGRRLWSAEEDAVIRARYAAALWGRKASSCAGRLPGRGKYAIAARAQVLGLGGNMPKCVGFKPHVFETIRDLAKQNKISFAEQVRRLVAKGLAVPPFESDKE